MEPEKIQRINELKRLSRNRELTEAEKEERASLRQEYIDGFRENMRQVLDSMRIQEEDGTLRPLQKKEDRR
jgi:uncharacterized protein YnzC (UPF0291/DUF896 family)